MTLIELVRRAWKRAKLDSIEKKIRRYPKRRERMAKRHAKLVAKYDALRAELDGSK